MKNLDEDSFISMKNCLFLSIYMLYGAFIEFRDSGNIEFKSCLFYKIIIFSGNVISYTSQSTNRNKKK